MVKYYVIQPGGEVNEHESPRSLDLNELQKHVGGFVEHVSVKFGGEYVHAFVNEEGKLRELTHNSKATAIFHNRYRHTEDDQYNDLSRPALTYLLKDFDEIRGPMVLWPYRSLNGRT